MARCLDEPIGTKSSVKVQKIVKKSNKFQLYKI